MTSHYTYSCHVQTWNVRHMIKTKQNKKIYVIFWSETVVEVGGSTVWACWLPLTGPDEAAWASLLTPAHSTRFTGTATEVCLLDLDRGVSWVVQGFGAWRLDANVAVVSQVALLSTPRDGIPRPVTDAAARGVALVVVGAASHHSYSHRQHHSPQHHLPARHT